jgi:hypothetical protein
MTAIYFYRCGLGRQQFMIHSWLSIPITMVGPKEARFRQVSLYISMHNNAVCNNSIRTRKNSLTPALFFKCLYQFVPSQASEQSCNCVIGVSSLHHSVIFLLKFWKCSDSVVFCIFFHFSTGLRNDSDSVVFVVFHFIIYISLYSSSQCITMVQRYNNKIKITTTIYDIYTN